MSYSVFLPYLFVMALVTYFIRAIPFVLIKGKIKNKFICTFLEYIPYSVLTAMTIPAIFYAGSNQIAAAVGFLTAVLLAFREKGLLLVALGASCAVFATELLMRL